MIAGYSIWLVILIGITLVPHAVGGAAGWVGGLGALGGFVLPPIMGIATAMTGGPEAYARGFLPVAALVLVAIPFVIALDRWNQTHKVAT
jgi:nitrate/nitrite transporter NarK